LSSEALAKAEPLNPEPLNREPSPMKSDFKQGRTGLVFKDGKLFEFTDRHVLVLSGWPDPRAWFKRRSHGWKATRKWADKLFSDRVFPRQGEGDWPGDPEAGLGLPEGEVALPGIPVSEEHARRMWYEAILKRERNAMEQFIGVIPVAPVQFLRSLSGGP